MFPKHAPLSWKPHAWFQGQHGQRSSPATRLHAGVLPKKPLQRLLTFLQDLLLSWALTLFSCQSYIASMPTPGQEPCWSEFWLWPHRFDFLAWRWIYLMSLHWSVNIYFWLETIDRPVMIALHWHCRPGCLWGDSTLPALLPGSPSLVEHSVLAQQQGYLSYNDGGKKI